MNQPNFIGEVDRYTPPNEYKWGNDFFLSLDKWFLWEDVFR